MSEALQKSREPLPCSPPAFGGSWSQNLRVSFRREGVDLGDALASQRHPLPCHRHEYSPQN